MNTNAVIGIVVLGGALIAYTSSKKEEEVLPTAGGVATTSANTTTTTTTDDTSSTDSTDDDSDSSSGSSSGSSNDSSDSSDSSGSSGSGDGSGTPDAQPPSYDCGNYKQSVDWHTWHTGTSNSKSTSTCANGVRWRNFKTDKKAYVQGETVNYEYEIQVKEWNPTRCGDTGCCLYRWKQCWFSPDDDGSMGKNDSDATWGVTFFDSQGSQMHKLRTAGATGRAYKTAEYLKIKGSFVIPNSAGAIGQWKANVFAMIPAYENNLYVDCGDLKAEENDIRVFYCYAKECKETSSAETFGAESSLWQSSFSNQSFMAF